MHKLILIPFGNESEIFIRASELWSRRDESSLNDWKVILYSFGDLNQEEPALLKDGVLYLKQHSEIAHRLISDSTKFSITGTWSSLEKFHFIYRRIIISRLILDAFTGNLLIFFTTATSVINANSLNAVTECLPSGLFIGGQFYTGSDDKGSLVFPSGAGFITNREGLSRFAQQTNISSDFDDVWSGRVLDGALRVRWPRFDLIHPTESLQCELGAFKARLQRVIDSGVWHLRIKIGNNRITSDRDSIESQLELLSFCHAMVSRSYSSPLKVKDLIQIVRD